VIGIDTNVLVRFLVDDHPAQSEAAAAVFSSLTETAPGYITTVVWVETYWVLRQVLRSTPSHIYGWFTVLLDNPVIRSQDGHLIRRAIARARTGADFADSVIAETSTISGCTSVVTFDRKAARALGWQLLP
jgi:predicted nucleic-acid-binding protein